MEKRRPLKIHGGDNANNIIKAIENGEGIMTEYHAERTFMSRPKD